ncbi:hypothetical protein [Lignipirellula cremea]|uniref:Uncharacterized protein n=1 Tax=Lignipirellula cremea TaxID=2528010 RepID=A0A518DR53_9BACT|nr:hypothetical protein [Lignipirellula cremea]QDU94302.1 hypothetical protein Pla8534_20910 [Lignipirellula cremea]
MSTTRRTTPALDALVRLFYPSASQLGEFREVESGELPPAESRLLDHEEHMTVTVESFHQSAVDVKVLETQITRTHYARKILLQRKTDGAVVQYGLVRLNFSFLPDEVREEIESQQTPLGRVLIEHDVLREVMLLSLWEIEPGEELRSLLALPPTVTHCYGRTAFIYCNGIPAVELLEVVTPVEAKG